MGMIFRDQGLARWAMPPHRLPAISRWQQRHQAHGACHHHCTGTIHESFRQRETSPHQPTNQGHWWQQQGRHIEINVVVLRVTPTIEQIAECWHRQAVGIPPHQGHIIGQERRIDSSKDDHQRNHRTPAHAGLTPSLFPNAEMLRHSGS